LRVDGVAPVGSSFALRATIAYKGSWVRMTRTVFRDKAKRVLADRAVEHFAAAIARLPSAEGFAGFRSWLIEGCKLAQPLEPLLGSMLDSLPPLVPGSLVTAQAVIEIEGTKIAQAAPVLIGTTGFPSSFLVHPVFG